MYNVKLIHRVKKLQEQCLFVEPAISINCPEEYKGIVFGQVDFSSIIHDSRSHYLKCSIPELHKCEVHCLTFDQNRVPVKSIKEKHPRTERIIRDKKRFT